MGELLARYLAPLTYALYIMLAVGGIDHFWIEFLPRPVAQLNLLALWPLLAAVWFGHKYKARMNAEAAGESRNRGA